ncbi:hypothetical protein [Arthrobacter sp. SDTb3-6]|uniref:hypothetical protein n=1 Tax=Arthrobacter sp. SDTb3-6 TaxID=2713571 RepID=UPI00159D39C8|nr:hypothetical protein [Arthrobacter sp. SDTb3-6]NVM97813.1 hypothetical protein [Arthrobacter sp. SDTb3-6]
MKAPDPYQDAEGIALVEGIMQRIGYWQQAEPVASIDLEDVVNALADWGVALQAWQLPFLNASRAMAGFVEGLQETGVLPEPAPSDPRARALWAKKHQGKGPPPSSSWRGRERNTKYRSQ